MTFRLTPGRAWIAGVLVALAVCVAPATAGAAPLYPDLRALGPVSLRLTKATVSGEQRHFLRFTAQIYNDGEGAMEVQRTPNASGLADLTQRIYEEPAGFQEKAIGPAVFDPLDFVFPIPHISKYELWTARAFERAQARGFTRGQPIAIRDNVSHCISDGIQITEEGPSMPVYMTCTKVLSGISVGWADVTSWFNDEPVIDLGTSPLPDGEYVVRAIADPENRLYESAEKSDPARESQIANSGSTFFRLIGGQFAGIE